jgi:hypothetical protein
VAQKKRPFTRRQRSHILRKRRMAERAEARAAKLEAELYQQSLDIFKRCALERTERLADEYRGQ